MGQIGSGKSSFINTIFSAMRNELGQLAFNAEDDKSTTTKVRCSSCKIRISSGDSSSCIVKVEVMGNWPWVPGAGGKDANPYTNDTLLWWVRRNPYETVLLMKTDWLTLEAFSKWTFPSHWPCYHLCCPISRTKYIEREVGAIAVVVKWAVKAIQWL